jgi:uncharacterized protein
MIPATLLSILLFAFPACNDLKEVSRELPDRVAYTPVDTIGKPFPQLRGYVNDFYSLFSAAERRSLDSLIGSYEQKTTTQITVITLDSSYAGESNFDAYTLALANKWGVGQKNKNNGILIGICPDYRRIRIHNGYGIQKYLSDGETKKILDDVIFPSFRISEYYRGVYYGILAITKKLEENRKR